MATHNGARYLEEQLASFVAQARPPDELVVSDDGSVDATLDILERFAEGAPFPVRIHRTDERLGFAQNFNRALLRCSGDLIFLSDQDDYWLPDKIRTVADIAARDPQHAVFVNDAVLTDSALAPTSLTALGQHRAAGLSEHAFVKGCCVAVRASFLSWILPIPEGYPSHDRWIVQFAERLGRRRIIETPPLQLYRRHPTTASAADMAQPRAVSRLRFMRARLRANLERDYAEVLEARRRQTCLMLDRAQSRLRTAAGTDELLERLVADLKHQCDTLDVRLRLLRTGRLKRLLPIAGMVLSGRYRRFYGGVWTALQDTILAKGSPPACNESAAPPPART
ncbi:MAG: glycosyltransferase [Vicinamibacteraceae bacterium]